MAETRSTDIELLRSKALLRPDEAARILRVHRGTVYRQVAAGRLDGVRVGSRLRIKSDSLVRYLRGGSDDGS